MAPSLGKSWHSIRAKALESNHIYCVTISDQLLGAWCPAVSAPGEWLEVRLPRPFNVTALLLQVPVVGLGDGQAPPTLDSFSVFLELASSPPGELTQFRGLDDSTEVSIAYYETDNTVVNTGDGFFLQYETFVGRFKDQFPPALFFFFWGGDGDQFACANCTLSARISPQWLCDLRRL